MARTNEFLSFYNKNASKIEAEIKTVYQKYGITMTPNGGSFRDDGTADVKFKISLDSATGGMSPTEARARSDFQQGAFMYGLKPEHLDKEVTLNREVFIIAGLMPKKQKFPILVKRKSDGLQKLFPSDYVAKMMGA